MKHDFKIGLRFAIMLIIGLIIVRYVLAAM